MTQSSSDAPPPPPPPLAPLPSLPTNRPPRRRRRRPPRRPPHLGPLHRKAGRLMPPPAGLLAGAAAVPCAVAAPAAGLGAGRAAVVAAMGAVGGGLTGGVLGGLGRGLCLVPGRAAAISVVGVRVLELAWIVVGRGDGVAVLLLGGCRCCRCRTRRWLAKSRLSRLSRLGGPSDDGRRLGDGAGYPVRHRCRIPAAIWSVTDAETGSAQTFPNTATVTETSKVDVAQQHIY